MTYPDPLDALARAAVRFDMDNATWLRRDVALVCEAALRHVGPVRAALDVGAGRGRLLPAIASVADQVVGLEPDPARAKDAVAQRIPRVTILPIAIAELACTQGFDLIVCSHVLQHMLPNQRLDTVAAVRQLCAPSAIVLVMFASTNETRAALYDTRARAGDAETSEILDPKRAAGLRTWHAGRGQMERLLANAGLDVVGGGPYRNFVHRVLTSRGHSHDVHAADAYLIAEAP